MDLGESENIYGNPGLQRPIVTLKNFAQPCSFSVKFGCCNQGLSCTFLESPRVHRVLLCIWFPHFMRFLAWQSFCRTVHPPPSQCGRHMWMVPNITFVPWHKHNFHFAGIGGICSGAYIYVYSLKRINLGMFCVIHSSMCELLLVTLSILVLRCTISTVISFLSSLATKQNY